MKLEIGSYNEFATRADSSTVYFNLKPENDIEKALLTALYACKGKVSCCNNFIEVSLTRKHPND